MFPEILRYTASRATQGVGATIIRKVVWIALAGSLFFACSVFLLMTAYVYLQQYWERPLASLFLAGVCLAAGLIVLAVRQLLDARELRRQRRAIASMTPLEAAKSDVKDVVDYFGPLRVVASGFMLGLGLGRRIRR